MADTTFTSGTVVASTWLNDVNYLTYKGGLADGASTPRTLNKIVSDSVNVLDFLSANERVDVLTSAYTLDCSVNVNTALAYAITNNKALYFPSGGYLAALSVHANNVSIFGDGFANTTIKLPATGITITTIQCTVANPNTVTITTSTAHNVWVGKTVSVAGSSQASQNVPYIVTGILSTTQFTASAKGFVGVVGTYSGGTPKLYHSSVLEIGEGPHGNSATAYSGFSVRGLTIDGNKAARVANPTDTSDWGIFLTNASNYTIKDVYVKNCQSVGAGSVILSNYGIWDVIVDSCGTTLSYPGFDINSSSHIVANVVSKNCAQGARVLDNCVNIQGTIVVYNATSIGFIHQNQLGNTSYNNQLNVVVHTSGSHGVVVGEGVKNSTLYLTTYNAGGSGVVLNTATNVPTNCIIIANTNTSQQAGLLSYANNSIITHTSHLDGRSGAAGSYYALDIYGINSTYTAFIYDSIAQVRGMSLRAASTDNEIVSFKETGTLGGTQDVGTRNIRPAWRGAIQSVASAATVTLPVLGDFFSVTGTTGITSITADQATRKVVLSFAGILTVTNGSNLKLTANFTTAAGSVLELVSDGTNWIELSRKT